MNNSLILQSPYHALFVDESYPYALVYTPYNMCAEFLGYWVGSWGVKISVIKKFTFTFIIIILMRIVVRMIKNLDTNQT